MYEYEKAFFAKGYTRIVGTDEAGRGPLAGPVVAAAVILNPDDEIVGLNDSKQLTEKQRDRLAPEIKLRALAWGVAFVSPAEIDRINIYQASRLAMMQAIHSLIIQPDACLSDAMPLPELTIPVLPIIHGDALSASIAAASILAKVARDAYMKEQEIRYPGYGFAQHKGYPTKQHVEALHRLGITPIHRFTYQPVRDVIEEQMRLDLGERLMKKTSAVIFDLDGTLLDTIEDITDSANFALSANGLAPYSIDEYKLFVGNGVDELVKGLLGEQAKDQALFDAVKAAYRKEYAIRSSHKTLAYPGMDSLLKKLNQRHIQICVLSNKPDSDTQSVIKRFFPTIEFAFVYGKKPEFPIKPDPASVLDIIKRLNVPKEAVLYVGDTGTDMATAVNANLEAIGVLWGFRHQEELLTHGANRLISSPEELLTIIETRE